MPRPIVPGTQGDVLPPKRQAVVDRLRRRIENYRRHQSDCIPKFDQTFNGLVEQNFQDTLVLKQRFLENKAKRAAKKTDKKTPESNLQGNAHPVSKLMSAKRPAEEPPQPPQQPPPTSSAEGLTKFSVEIVQQLEFTTCSSSSQISTNVTVKALNTSVKSAPSRPGSTPTPPQPPPPQPQPASQQQQQQAQHQQAPQQQPQTQPQQVSCKQEIDEYPEFVDLDQCAAALEKDAAANGHSFAGFPDLIGDDTSDAIITSDTFKDLINEISDYPTEFMKDFADYDGGVDIKPQINSPALGGVDDMGVANPNVRSYQTQQQTGPSGGGLPAELSPAAQTLKQMAEHHQQQHKAAQMGLNFSSAPPPRTPGPPGQPAPPPTIKQEVMYGSPGSGPGVPPPKGGTQQGGGGRPPPMGGGGYSPYGSPRGQAPPPRPSSGPTPPQATAGGGGAASATTLQISQAQQLHISQGQGQPIQVSMAQNMSTDVKQQASSVSVAAHQGLFFSQHHPHHAAAPSPGSPSTAPPSSTSSSVPHHPPPPHSSTSSTSAASSASSTSAPSATAPSGNSFCSTAVSQSQTINFTQQTMRLRPTANLLRPLDKMMMAHPQQQVRPPPPEYQSPSSLSSQQIHSMLAGGGGGLPLHRAPHHPMQQQQQQQHHPMGPHAPPPHLQAHAQSMAHQAPRFAPSMQQQQQRRMSQQPMPPSGPMMRPQQQIPTTAPGVYMSQQPQPAQQAYQQQLQGRTQLSQLIDSGPAAEWRQHQLLMAQHQQQQQQQPRPPPTFHQAQGVSFSGGGVQVTAGQEQVLPGGGRGGGGQEQALPGGGRGGGGQLLAHQQLAMHHQSMPPQMSINLHMAQAMAAQQQQQFPGSQQQFAGQQQQARQQQQQQQHLQHLQQSQQQQQQHHHQTFGSSSNPFGGSCYVPASTATGFPSSSSSSISSAAFQSSSVSVSSASGSGGGASSASVAASYGPPQLPNDLNLDFLEQLPSAHIDTSQMDLLNTLESGASFNLHDIL